VFLGIDGGLVPFERVLEVGCAGTPLVYVGVAEVDAVVVYQTEADDLSQDERSEYPQLCK